MSDAAIAAYFHEALYVEGYFGTQFAFHPHVVVYIFPELGNGGFVKVFNSCIGVNARCGKNFLGSFETYTVNIGETDFNSLLSG